VAYSFDFLSIFPFYYYIAVVASEVDFLWYIMKLQQAKRLLSMPGKQLQPDLMKQCMEATESFLSWVSELFSIFFSEQISWFIGTYKPSTQVLNRVWIILRSEKLQVL